MGSSFQWGGPSRQDRGGFEGYNMPKEFPFLTYQTAMYQPGGLPSNGGAELSIFPFPHEKLPSKMYKRARFSIGGW